MKRLLLLLAGILMVLTLALNGLAQVPSSTGKQHGLFRPPSALGKTPAKARTPLYVRTPQPKARFEDLAAYSYTFETPATLACIYGLVSPTKGCPTSLTKVPSGGSKAIALVDWGDDPNTQTDLHIFSTQFGLPQTTITKICLPTPPCPSNVGTGWDVETGLDVEYAHAMAPRAQIFLIEFTNNAFTDGAETTAGATVAGAGGGEVSNSWDFCFNQDCSTLEDPSETQYDQYFTTPGVVYFASADDSGWGAAYPSSSPNVISAGGTSVLRDANGNFLGENCWWGSGGGISQVEPRPAYQNGIQAIVRSYRGTPDLAADADPDSGVSVVANGYWYIIGGTSVSSPLLAGIVNATNTFRTSSQTELTQIYGEYAGASTYPMYFNDVTVGSNGYSATVGWDQCTGVGSTKSPSGY